MVTGARMDAGTSQRVPVHAECSTWVRCNGTVYTSYGFTDRAATRLAPAEVVQRALGHSTAATTLYTYSHLWPATEDRTRKAASGLMRQALRAAPLTQAASARPATLGRELGIMAETDLSDLLGWRLCRGSDRRRGRLGRRALPTFVNRGCPHTVSGPSAAGTRAAVKDWMRLRAGHGLRGPRPRPRR